MTDDNLPILILLGEPRPNVDITELDTVTSELTGKPLRHMELHVKVRSMERNEELLAELKSAGAPMQDTSGGSWRVRGLSYRYEDGVNSFAHTIELVENEQLNLTEVVIGSLSLAPERWKLDEDGKVLHFLVTPDAAQSDDLEQLVCDESDPAGTYFPVQLVGIRNEPVSMRFGRCLSQKLDDGRTRHLIRLVAEQPEDNLSGTGLLEPEMTRLKEAALKLDALIAELRNAGVLSEDAVSRIGERGANGPLAAWREFDRTRDVESFFTE